MPKNVNYIKNEAVLLFVIFYSLQNKTAEINPMEFNQDCKFSPELAEPSAALWHLRVAEPLCSGLLKSSGEDKAFKVWKKEAVEEQAETCPTCPAPTWAKFSQGAEDGNGEWMAHLPLQCCSNLHISLHSEQTEAVQIN